MAALPAAALRFDGGIERCLLVWTWQFVVKLTGHIRRQNVHVRAPVMSQPLNMIKFTTQSVITPVAALGALQCA